MPPSGKTDFRLPDLRFVPVESLVPHEWHDEQRCAPLVEKLRESGVLQNPPIVAPVGDGMRVETRYVVLDGANRSTAARLAGWPHVVVQVVRYEDPGLKLSTWYHGVVGLTQAELEAALAAIPGLERRGADRMRARALLARREALAYVVYDGGTVVTLHGGKSLSERNHLLNCVVNTYRDRARFVRVATDLLPDARAEHPEVTALVVFPHFEPAEVLELAGSGEHLPAGITRHLIPWRALRLNIPIAVLADSSMGLDEKNRWLEDWVRERLAARRVRFYEEPTVLFDE